jgi:FlaA1/EpsC-like NDP-sugar epimerase
MLLFKKSLLIYLKSLNLKLDINNLSYLPRWVVLFLDVFIVFVSLTSTYYLLLGVGLKFTQYNKFFILFLFGFFNIFFFWVFKTYSGIIRHSSFVDAIKIFFSQFTTAVFMVVLNVTLLFFEQNKLCLSTGILIHFVFSFSLLFLYRIFVKFVFENYFSNANLNQDISNRMRAVIFGTDSNATALANALKFENPGRFTIVGFFDKYNENYTKRILDLPIIKVKKSIPVMLRFLKVEALVIADNSLKIEEKNALIEGCIACGIKVFNVPLVANYDKGQDLSKSVKKIEIQDLLERNPIELNLKLISNDINGKVVFVSGAAGSIGSEIVRQVITFNPKKIILLDAAETPLHSLFLEISEKEVNVESIIPRIADIKDKEVLENILLENIPDVIFHAAAYKHVPMMENNPCQAVFTNVMGTKNLADLAVKFKVKKFVMISTDKAVNPSSVMGASKRIAEMYVQSLQNQVDNNDTKFVTTRFGNVLGSNGSVVPLFTKQINEGGPITITHPDIIRYFMTIPEACQLVLEASVMANGGEIYLFDMGKPVKIIDLAKKMIRLAGYVPYKDIDIKIVGLRPGEKLYEELLNDDAKCLPTHHEKITIATERILEYEELNFLINQLIIIAKQNEVQNVVNKIKELVPEYKSLNSFF